MLLGGVFKATGNRSPAENTGREQAPLRRARPRALGEHAGVPFQRNPHFPINTLPLMRLAVAAQTSGVFQPFHDELWPAFWADGKNLGDPEEVRKVLERAGVDYEGSERGRADAGGQGSAQGHHRGGGGARRVRCADLLRRRRDVLRERSVGLRRGCAAADQRQSSPSRSPRVRRGLSTGSQGDACTCAPGRTFWWPATMTCSPPSRPFLISTESSRNSPGIDFALAHRSGAVDHVDQVARSLLDQRGARRQDARRRPSPPPRARAPTCRGEARRDRSAPAPVLRECGCRCRRSGRGLRLGRRTPRRSGRRDRPRSGPGAPWRRRSRAR